MQDIVFYVAANETLGVVRDVANVRNQSAPILVLGVAARLRMRLFADAESTTPYPVSSFSGIAAWKWRMDADFGRDTPGKLIADEGNISVQTVTDTVDGEETGFTEFTIPISETNTLELSEWLGTAKKRSGLTGELVGYDSNEKAVFVLQVDDFTVRNSVGDPDEPTPIHTEYLTRSQTELLVQSAFSSLSAAKQDLLTSANAGAGISIGSGGVISNTYSYSLPYATAHSSGGVMLADGAEVVSGGNASKAITPAALNAALTGGTAFIPRNVVSAFAPIVNLGSAATVSLAAGEAYKLSAVSGDHYVTAETPPVGKYGMDAHLELFVGAATLVHVTDPLILMDALTPNAVNNCRIEYRDGTARMHVEDHDYGYVVTLSGGTTGTDLDGSLSYGLTGTTAGYIVFSHLLDGQTSVIPGGATVGRTVNIVGNGIGSTIVTGQINCAPKLNMSNLTISGNTGSDMFFAAAFAGSVDFENVVFSGNAGSFGLNRSGSFNILRNCVIDDTNIGPTTGTLFKFGDATVTGSTIMCERALGISGTGRTLAISNCLFDTNGIAVQITGLTTTATISGSTFAAGSNIAFSDSSEILEFSGANTLGGKVPGSGKVYLGTGSITGGVFDAVNIEVKANAEATVTGATFSRYRAGSQITTGSNNSKNTLVLTGCTISGGTSSSLANSTIICRIGTEVDLEDCTFGNTVTGAGSDAYAYTGVLRASGCTNAVFGSYQGQIVLGGTNSCRALFPDIESASGTLILEPDSVTTLSAAVVPQGASGIAVGTLSGGTVSVSGTATVIIGGNTLSVSGSGTYINADGTTDLATA